MICEVLPSTRQFDWSAMVKAWNADVGGRVEDAFLVALDVSLNDDAGEAPSQAEPQTASPPWAVPAQQFWDLPEAGEKGGDDQEISRKGAREKITSSRRQGRQWGKPRTAESYSCLDKFGHVVENAVSGENRYPPLKTDSAFPKLGFQGEGDNGEDEVEEEEGGERRGDKRGGRGEMLEVEEAEEENDDSLEFAREMNLAIGESRRDAELALASAEKRSGLTGGNFV